MQGLKKCISVFVSSAQQELEYDRDIVKDALDSMNANPVLFEVLPAMSESPSVACRRLVREFDIFVILLWKSLRSAVLDEYQQAARSSKPILIFVKDLAANEERGPELSAFLDGLLTGSGPYMPQPSTYKSYRRIAELKEAVRESVSNEIAKFCREPIARISRQEMYELGTEIVQTAHKRLYLYEKTPSLILGARDYLMPDKMKRTHEKDLYGALTNWIHGNDGSRLMAWG